MKRRNSHSGFTLLELILVMLILAIAAAMVVPSLRTFAIARRTDNIVTSLLTLANYARIHAINEGRTYRMNFDTQAHSVWLTVQNGAVYEAPKSEFGDKVALPDGVSMNVTVVVMPNTLLMLPTNAQVTAVTPPTPFGRALAQPNSVMQVAHSDPGTYTEFQPNGRMDPILVRLTDSLGRQVNLGSQTTTETLHLLDKTELQ